MYAVDRGMTENTNREENMKWIKHTQDSLKLTDFARRNPGWQSYAKDKKTLRAVDRAEFLQAIIVDRFTGQFKAK